MSEEPSGRFRWVMRLGCLAIVACVVVLAAIWLAYFRFSGRGATMAGADNVPTTLIAELRADVTRLGSEIGERNLTVRPAHLEEAAQFIESELKKAGYVPERQTYKVDTQSCSNIIAEMAGKTLPGEIVVIGSHYDSAIGSPAANDNGSGVAAMLAIARRFAGKPWDRTLRFVAFVNEEPPYFQSKTMGSVVYAQRCRERHEKIAAMLSLETIGYFTDAPNSQNYPPPFGWIYPSQGNFIGVVGNLGSRKLVENVIKGIKSRGFPCEGAALPEFVTGVGFSDQWSFWQSDYPAVMITDTAMFRYPYYHTADDTPDKLTYEPMARLVESLLHVVQSLVTKQ